MAQSLIISENLGHESSNQSWMLKVALKTMSESEQFPRSTVWPCKQMILLLTYGQKIISVPMLLHHDAYVIHLTLSLHAGILSSHVITRRGTHQVCWRSSSYLNIIFGIPKCKNMFFYLLIWKRRT
ncbi:neurexophilin-1 isoform X3 [Canis lupus familiaris]|uniref:neurexophilin-1 isoform X3 n=1 Tax=Canis lupus familiaris TaxID=9615 RepID=UPI0018F2E71C|nr:neurexophilin-1 isoform X3 [Canis lupus familiaris]XP_038290978.1 neurexophilin-1 isoform X3 [Canis lupus familiaris]XP_038290986.1 neurexophilin-1 isoform X3 [Canis lupus familiaris]